MRLTLHVFYVNAFNASLNKGNFEYMAYKERHGNEKGIAAKIVDGDICIDIEKNDIQVFLATIPCTHKNWIRLKLIPRLGSASFHVEPVRDPKTVAEYKKAV